MVGGLVPPLVAGGMGLRPGDRERMDPTKLRIIQAAGLTTAKQVESFREATRNVKGYTTVPGYVNMNGHELLYVRSDPRRWRPYVMHCPKCDCVYRCCGSEIYSSGHPHYPWHDAKPAPKKRAVKELVKLVKARADLQRTIKTALARGEWMLAREYRPQLQRLDSEIDALLGGMRPDAIRQARALAG